MKRILMMFVAALVAVASFAQADKIVGTYKCERNGVKSKVKVFKAGDGYRAQVIWADNLKMPDGSTRLDPKNPDPAKRNTPADQIVLIEKVAYNAKESQWENGKIYDPTNGKTYTTRLKFTDDKTLRVRGYIGPFHESMYWTKID